MLEPSYRFHNVWKYYLFHQGFNPFTIHQDILFGRQRHIFLVLPHFDMVKLCLLHRLYLSGDILLQTASKSMGPVDHHRHLSQCNGSQHRSCIYKRCFGFHYLSASTANNLGASHDRQKKVRRIPYFCSSTPVSRLSYI
jgi:hypothetical protein